MTSRHPIAIAAAFLLLLAPRGPAGTAAQSAPGITVPPGFEVELVAAPPLVERPIVADFDEAGRLYVADSSGSNDRTEKQLEDRPHRIVRLDDTNGDGRFDRSVVFADRMMLPEGAMWFEGSLYVAAPPSIWRLTDTDGDGIADRREEWFEGKTLTGCANDLHGPYLGPDGWIYWTKGAFAEQIYESPDGRPFVTRASHILRRRPGDPRVEVVMTGGMDNPVDVAFTASGERILTATFVEHPQQGRRDALLHAVYGGVYGKPHGVLDGHRRTGDLMPVMAHLGPAVPAGLTRYASAAFGREYRDSFFAAMFNLHKVTRFELTPSGATFEARASDFLVSTNRDFHPTDVVEDADGSLLVIDTGPWYKLCCPTSQLAKPDIPGAIYRVRRSGAPARPDPRGLRLAWDTMAAETLVQLLDDERVAVQRRAIERLAQHAGAVPALQQALRTSASVEMRRNAVWTLARVEAAEARAAVREALADRDESVRQAAAHVAGLWQDRTAIRPLVGLIREGSPAMRRSAAEALGRVGESGAVADLLAAVDAAAEDRVLEHSLVYALMEIGDAASLQTAGFGAVSPRTRRAALIALDQIDAGRLTADTILPLLDGPDPLLNEAAWWIAERHPEWGTAMAGFFAGRLSADPATADADSLRPKLSRFATHADVQTLLAHTVERSGSPAARRLALGAMAGARVKEVPAAWVAPLVAALRDTDSAVVREAVTVVRTLRAPKDAEPQLQQALQAIARTEGHPLPLRLDALAALPGGRVEGPAFALLCQGIAPEQPVAVRMSAAAALERAVLDDEQLIALARVMAEAGPLELPRLLAPFERSRSQVVGLALLAALERAPGRSSIRPDTLRRSLDNYPDPVRARGGAVFASAHGDVAAQARRLDAMLVELAGGDVRRGQQVFNSDKAGCAACHAIGYMGGTLGPDLTRIGEVRAERDLLEAVVFPNASFARGFEPVVVATRRGDTHSGIIRSEGRDELVLVTAAQQELTILRSEIHDLQPATISMMPGGLDEQLTRQELADLLAFLKATRWK